MANQSRFAGDRCQEHGTYPSRDCRECVIDRLEGWKAEALVVLDQWEECYTILEAAGHGAPIGRSKALHVADYLRAHVS